MKLSTLSKRVVAPLAASFTLLSGPAFAKSDLFDRGYAMGVQAGAHCHADKGYISKYQVNAITKGTDAQAEVSVRLEDDGLSVLGVGNDIDTMVASGKAYINGLNKLFQKKDKAADSKKALNSQAKKIDKHVI